MPWLNYGKVSWPKIDSKMTLFTSFGWEFNNRKNKNFLMRKIGKNVCLGLYPLMLTALHFKTKLMIVFVKHVTFTGRVKTAQIVYQSLAYSIFSIHSKKYQSLARKPRKRNKEKLCFLSTRFSQSHSNLILDLEF